MLLKWIDYNCGLIYMIAISIVIFIARACQVPYTPQKYLRLLEVAVE